MCVHILYTVCCIIVYSVCAYSSAAPRPRVNDGSRARFRLRYYCVMCESDGHHFRLFFWQQGSSASLCLCQRRSNHYCRHRVYVAVAGTMSANSYATLVACCPSHVAYTHTHLDSAAVGHPQRKLNAKGEGLRVIRVHGSF